MKSAIHTLRVNIKSLAAESKIIRQEIKKTKDTDIKNSLHLHRITKVRDEARSAHLALAAVKNTPYNVIECGKTHPNWARVKEKFLFHTCGKNSSDTIKTAMKEHIDRWIEYAKKCLSYNGVK